MENRINIAELLKDCPTGMELDCLMYDNLYFKCIREHAIYPIVCYTIDSKGEKEEITFNWYGKYALIDTAKCVIFPKGKTTWEGFHRPFKDGDIVALDTEKGAQLFIFKEYIYNHDCVKCYMMLDCGGEIDFEIGDYYVERFATEEEKRKLFKAINDNGYRWNSESKTLEKLIEPEFNVGDWIIRNNKYTGIPVKVVGFNGYYSCELNGEVINIPRNDIHNNFHLWTIDDAKDGDVIFYDSGWTCIFKNIHGIWYSSYCFITDDGEFHTSYETHAVDSTINGNPHPATEEQCKLLFQKIKEAGYKWNPETKVLEKLTKPQFKVGDVIQDEDGYKVKITEVNIEDERYGYESMITKVTANIVFSKQDKWELVPNKFDITTLKPFDKVLARDTDNSMWIATLFSHLRGMTFYTVGGWYNQCIPFEGNEHLIGKTDNCTDFYKNWE